MTINHLWYEKYRPKTLDEYVWVDEDLKNRVSHYLSEPGKTPHLCMVGRPGTGKTTLTWLIARALVKEESDICYINASKQNGADMVRNIIEPFCQNAGWSELKFVILDEAERLTRDAQEILRGTINDYGSYVRFFFTCNSSASLRDYMDSRIRTIEFKGLDRDQFLERLIEILLQEGIELDDKTVGVATKTMDAYYPDLRKSIDMLEEAARGTTLIDIGATEVVDKSLIDEILGNIRGNLDYGRLRTSLAGLQPDQILNLYQVLDQHSEELFGKEQGLAIIQIRDHMIDHSRAGFPAMNLMGLIVKLVLLKESLGGMNH